MHGYWRFWLIGYSAGNTLISCMDYVAAGWLRNLPPAIRPGLLGDLRGSGAGPGVVVGMNRQSLGADRVVNS
jgi:hypothetical protein